MKLSPLLREKLGEDPSGVLVKVILEVDKDKADYVIANLREMGLRPEISKVSTILDSTYIPVTVPDTMIMELTKIEGVKEVHKSLPRAIGGMTQLNVPFISAVKDELIGEVRIPAVEVPVNAFLEALPNPITAVKAIANLAKPLTGVNPITKVKIIPTGQTYKILKEGYVGNNGKGVIAAVLDTGSPALTYQFVRSLPKLEEYTVIPEPPQDYMGHGSWCSNCVYGPEAPSIYGKIVGGAPDVNKAIHVKVLNTFPGAGSTEGILQGIATAVAHGAQVISMSLGGPAEGSPLTDLECKVINGLSEQGIIFCIAMGNSGPSLWTGGSPGVALKALTVASVSILDNFNPAWWSSRGMGSEWDEKHQDEFSKLLNTYGDELIKPDCSATGGGRAFQDTKPDEVIFSGENGWFEGFYDGIKDGAGSMHGTCVVGDTPVFTPDGPVEIENLKVDDEVWSFDGHTLSRARVTNKWNRGTKEILRVYVNKLGEIYATPNHPFLVFENGELKWKPASELRKGSVIVATRSLPENVSKELVNVITPEIAKLLGYFTSKWLARGLRYLALYSGLTAGVVKYRERVIKPPHSKEPRLWKTYQMMFGFKDAPDGHSYGKISIDSRHLRLARITSIEEHGKDKVWDIEVYGYNNFVADGFVVHNSQATPHVAGLVACLLSDGVINNVDDIKSVLRETASEYIIPDPINTDTDTKTIENYGKSIATGWGLFKLSRFKR